MSEPKTRTDAEVLKSVLDALDEEPPDADEGAEVVKRLGVDIPALAAKVRAQIAAASEESSDHARLRREYEQAEARRAKREREPIRPRDEQIARIRELVARAGERRVAVHFRNLDEASDDELAEIATELAELLDDETD